MGHLRARPSTQTRIPLYQRAEGFGFPGVRVDGNDVLASYAVTRKALDDARTGQGPTLIEAFTYRMGAHTTSDDPTRYRLASELEAWKLKDPLERMKSFLYKQQLVDAAFFGRLEADADALAARIRKGCLEMPDPEPLSIFDHVYAEQTVLLDEQREEFASYLAGFATRVSTDGADDDGKALNEGLRTAMEDDPKVLLMGEDIGKLGGVFRVTDGLQKDFGEDRVIDTPLAESGIVGTAIGLAMRGYRPVCEIQFDGFVYPAYDQIVSQLAKMPRAEQGQRADAGDDPHPVRRWDRRGRAPQREPGGVLRAHRGPEGRGLLQPGRRVLHDPAGDRLRRPGGLLRAQAALLGEGRGRPSLTPGPAVQAAGGPARAPT